MQRRRAGSCSPLLAYALHPFLVQRIRQRNARMPCVSVERRTSFGGSGRALIGLRIVAELSKYQPNGKGTRLR